MLTTWCLTVAFLTPWAVGIPALWLIRGCRVPRPSDWLWAPFIGLAALVCALQPLVVFADIPLRHSAPWFVTGVAIGWAALLMCRSGRASVRGFPLRVAALSLAVYLASGVGVLAEGAEQYRGNMLSDQYQYVALAQFLVEEPISTGWPDLGQRPWLVQPVALKAERLGQSVVHGFLAVVTRRDALDLYFPTQLLGPALLCPAVLLLATQFRFNRRLATCAAVASALAPGTATLQSLCFLSQALCVPALVAFLAAVVRLSRGGGLRPLPYAAAAFGFGFAVYTEFTPLFLGAAGAALVTGWVHGSIRARRIAAVVAGLAVAVAVFPAAAAGAVTVWERSLECGSRMTLNSPVPVWAACLWVNSDSAYRFVMANYAIKVRILVSLSFTLTAAGAVALAIGALRGNRGALPAVVGVGSLLVPPLFLWVVRPGSVYMISKLLWTLTPFWCCSRRARRGHSVAARRGGISGPWAGRLSAAVFCSLAGFWVYHNVFEQQLYLDPADRHAHRAHVERPRPE